MLDRIFKNLNIKKPTENNFSRFSITESQDLTKKLKNKKEID